MITHLLLFLFDKLELLGNVFFNNRSLIADFIFKYLILFVAITKASTNFKMFEKVSNCRHYRQIISDESLSDLVNQIKKIHGV